MKKGRKGKNYTEKGRRERHHVIPRSRGGKCTIMVDKYRHALFHILFWNLLPEEAISQLNKEFFGNKYEIEIRRKK